MILIGLLWIGAFHCWLGNACQPLKIDRILLDAIRQVESGGNIFLVGDLFSAHHAYGPYQITRPYYNDAVGFCQSLTDGGNKDFGNVRGVGSIEYSERVMESYMGRYATRRRLRREPTYEDIARIHNGGPNGYRRSSTISYWRRVQQAMNGRSRG